MEYTQKQVADLQAGAIKLVGSVMNGANYEATCEVVYAQWVVENGPVPIPPDVPQDASGRERSDAARNRFMLILAHLGRVYLHHILPLLQCNLVHLADLVTISNSAPEQGQTTQDVHMEDPEPRGRRH